MTKLNRLANAVKTATGGQIAGFEAAEVAAAILAREGGNLARAISRAKSPYRVGGRYCY